MSYISEMRKYIGHAPMLTAGATVVVVNNGRILLTKRADTKTWSLPGGAIELGETLEETAARELKEETNLFAESFEFLHLFSGRSFRFIYPNGDELYTVTALYRAKGVTGDLRVNDRESLDVKYFELNNLPELESRAALLIDWLRDNTFFI